MLNILIGIIGGVLSGMLGIGGGIILVPLMVAFLGFSQIKAQGTSIGALILPVGIFAAYKYYSDGNLDISVALKIAAGMFVGAWFGAQIAAIIPELYLKKSFGVLMIFAGIKMFLSR